MDHTVPADVAAHFDDARPLTLGPSAVFLAFAGLRALSNGVHRGPDGRL